MLKGDLTTTPLVPLVRGLADDQATGCLHVYDSGGDEALVYFKNGLIYSVSVPGRRPQLGSRLVSSGALAPEALAEALEAQRTELQGWRLGELLVHLGYVDQPVVEAFVNEQAQEAVWDLLRWPEGTWKFRKNERTREDVTAPVTVDELVDTLRDRRERWEEIAAVVPGPGAVPVLSTRSAAEPETVLDPDAWSLLCKVDGERSVAELARECGYTLFEVGQVLLSLIAAGLVDVDEDHVFEDSGVEEAPTHLLGRMAAALSGGPTSAGEAEGEADLADVLDLDSEPALELAELGQAEDSGRLRLNRSSTSFADAIARVSAQLADVLGPERAGEDPFEVPADLRISGRRRPADQNGHRRDRQRAAAAAELAAATAMAEALRRQATEAEQEAADAPAAPVAEVVDLEAVRREAALREAEETARAEAEAAERARAEAEAAERDRRDEEIARRAAELAAEEEAAAALAAEIAAAEDDAWAEYWVREAEEQARRDAEEQAARLAAEIAAAEDDAWAEYWVREAEVEAARLAAEAEAARLAEEEAARIAAEEAARIAAEEAARLAAEEADRIAAEEAARIAAEEAARLAAEEAARIAAEEAARLAAEEADRIAAEEADRIAAEEAGQLAAEVPPQPTADESVPVPKLKKSETDRKSKPERRKAPSVEVMSEFTAAAAAVATAAEEAPEPADADFFVQPAPAPVPAMASEMTDKASLLRELSSLGLEDEPPVSAPTRPPPNRPAPAEKKPKRRGLFGR